MTVVPEGSEATSVRRTKKISLHVMKACRVSTLQLHPFLTLVPVTGEWSLPRKIPPPAPKWEVKVVIPVYAMKAYRGVHAWLPLVSTSALDRSEKLNSRPVRFAPATKTPVPNGGERQLLPIVLNRTPNHTAHRPCHYTNYSFQHHHVYDFTFSKQERGTTCLST